MRWTNSETELGVILMAKLNIADGARNVHYAKIYKRTGEVIEGTMKDVVRVPPEPLWRSDRTQSKTEFQGILRGR